MAASRAAAAVRSTRHPSGAKKEAPEGESLQEAAQEEACVNTTALMRPGPWKGGRGALGGASGLFRERRRRRLVKPWGGSRRGGRNNAAPCALLSLSRACNRWSRCSRCHYLSPAHNLAPRPRRHFCRRWVCKKLFEEAVVAEGRAARRGGQEGRRLLLPSDLPPRSSPSPPSLPRPSQCGHAILCGATQWAQSAHLILWIT